MDYKKFTRPELDFLDLVGEVKMQGFREAIEVLEEMDRADNLATKYIQTLKCLYDSWACSSKPISKESRDAVRK